MEKNPFEMTRLLWKFLLRELPKQEEVEFEENIERIPALQAIYEELQDKEETEKALSVFAGFDTEKALKKVHRRHRSMAFLRFRYVGIAAAVCVLLGTAVFWASRYERMTEITDERMIAERNVRIVLKTAGGQVYGLDTLSTTIEEGQHVVFANRSGMLNVAELAGDGEVTAEDVQDNVVEVPYGGTYILCLQDSTRVYLNSGSCLEFPSRFASDERRVKISGEAFFEVKHHTEWPFVVSLPEGQIQVWGTSFNVKAYPEEEMIFTTLVEGKVSFHREAGKEMYLQPGEQLGYHKSGGQMALRRVDTRLYTAWKDGLFWFQDMPLEEILKMVGRWFDMEIVYLNPEIKNMRFSGKMKMYSSVEDILRKFEKSNEIAFQRKDNALMVYRK